jgi:hypothetical protein
LFWGLADVIENLQQINKKINKKKGEIKEWLIDKQYKFRWSYWFSKVFIRQ